MQESTIRNAGGDRGSATGGVGVQRKAGALMEALQTTGRLCGGPQGARVPVWAEGCGGADCPVEKVTGSLSSAFLCACLKKFSLFI